MKFRLLRSVQSQHEKVVNRLSKRAKVLLSDWSVSLKRPLKEVRRKLVKETLKKAEWPDVALQVDMDHEKEMVQSSVQKAELLKAERTALHVAVDELVEKQSRKSPLVLRLRAWHDHSWVVQRKVPSLRCLQLQERLKALVSLREKKLDAKVLKMQSLKRSLSPQVVKQSFTNLRS